MSERRKAFEEVIAGYDQLIEIFTTGGQAALTGHAYDPKEKDREIDLLKQLRIGLVEMRDAS
jgi:hypothetical protein